MKQVRFIFFFAVTLLIFYFIFQEADFPSVKEAFSNIRLSWLILSIGITFLTTVLAAKKWQAMLKAINHRLSFKDSFKVIMAAFPVSAITPAKAGDLIRAHYLKNKVPADQTVGAVITERFVDVFVLAFYSFMGAVFLKNGLILAISLFIIFLIPLFFLVVSKIKLPPSKWQGKIENFLHILKIFIHQPKKLLPVLFYAVMLWSALILEAKILFLAMGVNIPALYVAAAFPLAIFIGLIPVTIAGMGTRDSAIIYLFSPWAASNVSLGVGILYSLLGYWLLAILGLFFMKKQL